MYDVVNSPEDFPLFFVDMESTYRNHGQFYS